MRPGQLLVDAGCGTGASASGRPVPWPCAWTASTSPRSLSTKPPRAARFLASVHTRATFRVADLQNTASPSSAAHGIVSIDALGRARDRDQAVAELGRVLAPGGRLVMTRPPVSLPPWAPTRQSSSASAPSSLPAPPRTLALRLSCGHGGWDCVPPTRSAPTVQNSASAPPGLASWPAPTGPH
ncbi:class I SAM-dependent methyltransferase [Streptomyces sp. NPDC102409]|uniref:class I SAM-dependent methyltransferase n=1 Tax=Streptomyces sp. NPDC102409 TaxID=3366172 RepID=UPI0038132D5C